MLELLDDSAIPLLTQETWKHVHTKTCTWICVFINNSSNDALMLRIGNYGRSTLTGDSRHRGACALAMARHSALAIFTASLSLFHQTLWLVVGVIILMVPQHHISALFIPWPRNWSAGAAGAGAGTRSCSHAWWVGRWRRSAIKQVQRPGTF